MSLAIFDLDNTLIGGDSDFLWGEFLGEEGVVDANAYREMNEYFYQQYDLGVLDIYAWLEFCLEPLSRYSMTELEAFHHQFMIQKIEPIMLDKAQNCIDRHKEKGDTVLVMTATNSFVTAPIAKNMGLINCLLQNLKLKRVVIQEECQVYLVFKRGKLINCCPGFKKMESH